MSCQNCHSLPEILTLLKNITTELSGVKAKCCRIEKEILGISNEAEANPIGIMENITLKQIVERTAYDVECLKQRLDEQEESRRVEAHSKEQQSSNAKEGNELAGSSAKVKKPFIPKDIISKTVDEEMVLVKKELDAVKKGRTLVTGKSFGDRTLAEITNFLIPATSTSPVNLFVVINNYLGNTVKMNYWDGPGKESWREIAGGTNELVLLSSVDRSSHLLELAIVASDNRIFLITCNGCNSSGCETGVLVFITTQANIQLSPDLFNNFLGSPNELWRYSTNVAHKQSRTAAELLAVHGEIRVRAEAGIGQHAVVSLDIGSVQGPGICPPLAVAPVSLEAFVKPQLKSDGSLASVLSSIRRSRACAIQIGNALPANLEEGRINLHSGSVKAIPNEIKTKTSDYAVAFCKREFQGVISYRVGTTDLRLTLGFRLGEEGNEFAIGFFSLEAAPENSFLFDEDPYFSSPDRTHGKASDGTLRIIRRNIVAEAKMNNDKKAVLEVLIATV